MSPALHEFIANYGLWAVLGGTLLEGERGGVRRIPGAPAPAAPAGRDAVRLRRLADRRSGASYLGRRWRDHRLVLRLRAKPAFAKALAAVDRHPDGFILSLRFLYGLRTVGPIALGVSACRLHASWCSTWWRRPSGPCASACWAICSDRPSSRCWGGCMASKPLAAALAVAAAVAGPSLAGETPPLMKRKAPCLDRPGRLRRAPHTSNLPPTRSMAAAGLIPAADQRQQRQAAQDGMALVEVMPGLEVMSQALPALARLGRVAGVERRQLCRFRDPGVGRPARVSNRY